TEEFLGPNRLLVLAADGTVEWNEHAVPCDPLAESRSLVYSRPARLQASYLSRQRAQSSFLGPLADFQLTRLLASPNRSSPSILFSYAWNDELREGHKRLLDGVSNLAYFYVRPLDIVRETYERLS